MRIAAFLVVMSALAWPLGAQSTGHGTVTGTPAEVPTVLPTIIGRRPTDAERRADAARFAASRPVVYTMANGNAAVAGAGDAQQTAATASGSDMPGRDVATYYCEIDCLGSAASRPARRAPRIGEHVTGSPQLPPNPRLAPAPALPPDPQVASPRGRRTRSRPGFTGRHTTARPAVTPTIGVPAPRFAPVMAPSSRHQ
jgi:hypothetical protein